MLLFIMISRHRKQQNPVPAQPASPPPPQPRRRRKPQNPWVMPWILQREERVCYRTLLDELITTDVPGYRNFTRMEPAFFYLIEERIRVLLTTMKQRPKVVRDIVLTCVVLHNMLRSNQVGADRPPTPADDIQVPQADQGNRDIIVTSVTHWGRANINETYWKTASITWGAGWAGGQGLRRPRREHAVLYQSFSGLPK